MWMRPDWSKCQSSSIWGVFWMNQVQMMPSGRKAVDAIRSLINARGLQLEEFFALALLYDSETMKWREKERAVQIDNFEGG